MTFLDELPTPLDPPPLPNAGWARKAKEHADEHHRLYLCHCRQVFMMCNEIAAHWDLPADHSWVDSKIPLNRDYSVVLKCPADL